jgi:twitching motility protein PilT
MQLQNTSGTDDGVQNTQNDTNSQSLQNDAQNIIEDLQSFQSQNSTSDFSNTSSPSNSSDFSNSSNNLSSSPISSAKNSSNLNFNKNDFVNAAQTGQNNSDFVNEQDINSIQQNSSPQNSVNQDISNSQNQTSSNSLNQVKNFQSQSQQNNTSQKNQDDDVTQDRKKLDIANFQIQDDAQRSQAEQKINKLLQFAADQKASDLHMSAGRYPTIRVDGALVPLEQEPVNSPEDTEAIANFLMSDKSKADFKNDGHADLAYSLGDKVRFRVNVFRQQGRIGIVMRVISSEIKTLDQLNVSNIVYDFANYSQGLFLVTGPVGHGKSTTLAALVDYINHNKTHNIVTIEDPIEYIYKPDRCIINQREIGQDAFTFKGALRAALREDTNVIMVGEMRDLETISTAITAAETGHLIFATLHTNDAAQTVERIIDTFPSHQQNQVRSQLASVLLGVMAQRLLPKVGGGRVPATEIMIKNSAIENLIRESKTYQIDTVIETSQNEGMISLDKSLAELLMNGVITEEQMLIYAKNKEYAQMLARGGVQESIYIDE